MENTNELALLLEELRKAHQLVNEIVDKISALFPKEKKKEIKLEEVRAVLADKARNGHSEAIRELLKKYGADRLSAIDPANYQALLEEAEELENAT